VGLHPVDIQTAGTRRARGDHRMIEDGLCLHVQQNRGNQLRLPQQKARHCDSAGPVGPVAGVPADRRHGDTYRVGPDDLAVGAGLTPQERFAPGLISRTVAAVGRTASN